MLTPFANLMVSNVRSAREPEWRKQLLAMRLGDMCSACDQTREHEPENRFRPGFRSPRCKGPGLGLILNGSYAQTRLQRASRRY